MNCKNCSTPIGRNARSCPSCGRQVGASLGSSGLHEQKSPGGSKLAPAASLEEEVELPLQDEVSKPETTASRAAEPSYRKSKTSTPTKAKGRSASEEAPVSQGPSDGPTGSPTPAEVRAMIVEQPELLESGLSVERNKSNKSIGANLSTDVGAIDLLARDDAGGLVVVMVPETGADKDIVGEVLQRVGWVRKRHAKKGQDVRAIVIMAEIPDDVAYAAAAVSDTVSFKAVKLQIAFEDVDV